MSYDESDAREDEFWESVYADFYRPLTEPLRAWAKNRANPDEAFWQGELARNAFVLSQVFSKPMVIIQERAYVGGKGIDDTGGKLVDFLAANPFTDNAALIEIKTPKTPLLGGQYRAGVYAPSADLAGAIVQVLTYKDTLTKGYYSLVSQPQSKFDVYSPDCIVLAGDTEQIGKDKNKKRSFELFRASLKDVKIITFDELYAKMQALYDLLS